MRKISLDIFDNSGHKYFLFVNRMLADLVITSLPSVVVKQLLVI